MGIVAAYAVPHPPLAMPEVGRGQERAIQDTLDAYREVARRIAAHAPETIVVVSPHAPLFRDCFHLSTGDFDRGDMGRFGAWDSSMTVQYDGEMTAAIAACARKHTVPLCGSGMGGKDLDHATIVPLHFVNEAYSTYQVVRIGLSGLSPQTHLALGRCIAEAAADLDRSCVLIASGDLSHKLASDGPYGYAPQGPVFDRMVTALFDAGDRRDVRRGGGGMRPALVLDHGGRVGRPSHLARAAQLRRPLRRGLRGGRVRGAGLGRRRRRADRG